MCPPREGSSRPLIDRGARLLLLLLLLLPVLGGCSAGTLGSLVPLGPFTGTDALVPHYREHMVPLVLIGETVYLPPETCVGPIERHLGTSEEERPLVSDRETRVVTGVGEDRRLDGASEERELAGADEDRSLGAQDESRELAGEDESRGLAREEEDRRLGGNIERVECRRLGENAFQILQAERLQPRIYLGQGLVPVPDGSVTF